MAQALTTELRSTLAALLTVTLFAAPLPALAAPEPAPDAAPDADPSPEPAPETEAQPSQEGDVLSPEPTVAEVEEAEQPKGGGVAGSIVDPDDPNATRAQSDLEGESLDTKIVGIPERLPKLQAAGWWTTFGAITLATTGGVLAGVAETREDDAKRIAYSFNLDTGMATLYADVSDDYERALSEGQTYQAASRGLIIAGGVTLLVGVGLFIADGVKRKRGANGDEQAQQATVIFEPGSCGLRLRF